MYVLTELCRPVQLVVCGSLLGSVTDINWKSMQTLCPDSGNYTPWPSFPWDVHLVLSLFSYSNSWTATLYKSRTHTHWSLSSILIFNVTLQCVILEVWDQLFFLQGFRSGTRNRSDKESCGSKHNLLQSDCNIETESSGKQRVGVSAVLNRWTCKWACVCISNCVCCCLKQHGQDAGPRTRSWVTTHRLFVWAGNMWIFDILTVTTFQLYLWGSCDIF